MTGTGSQLRDTVQEIKDLALELNEFLYVDGDLRESHSSRHRNSEYTVEECLVKLEKLRNELWWIYNDNQSFADTSGFGRFK